MDVFVISSLPPMLSEVLHNSRAPSLHRRYPASSLQYGPIRHPLAFSSFPGVSGYRTYLAPAISRRGEEGFSSCLACPCQRAVASTPPKWCRRFGQISATHAAFALRLQAQPSDLFTFEATSTFTSVTARWLVAPFRSRCR